MSCYESVVIMAIPLSCGVSLCLWGMAIWDHHRGCARFAVLLTRWDASDVPLTAAPDRASDNIVAALDEDEPALSQEY